MADDHAEFARILADSLRFTYESSGSARVPGGYSTGWRIMPTALVGMLLEGEAVAEIDDREPLPFHAGMAICLPAGVHHRITHPVASASASCHVHFRVFSAVDVLSLVTVPTLIGGVVAQRIGRINRDLTAAVPAERGVLATVCARQALGLTLLSELVGAGTMTTRAVEALRAAQRLSPALATIDHDPSDIDLTALARRVKLSPSRLNATFRQAFACAPMQYVRRRRVQLARELLTTTSLSIGDVAERSGYDDQFHFSRAFKQIHGISPSGYRQQMSEMLF